MRIKFALIALLAAFASPVGAQTQWHDNPAVKQLYEAAKKESSVTVWSNATNVVDWIPAGFAKAFPGVEVKYLGDSDVGVKAVAEYRAGRFEVDVFMTSFTTGKPMVERNMYAKVDWSIFGTTGDNVTFDGRGALTDNLIYVVSYNKSLVKPGDLPKSWTDLLDPKYKDKMVGNAFTTPRLMGSLGMAWREDKMLEYSKALMNNGLMVTRAPSQNLLQTGERLYAIGSFDSNTRLWASQGLPIDFVIPEPVIAVQFFTAVMEKAPHPNAARLLAGFLSSQEGKDAATAANFQRDYRKGAKDPLAREIWSSNKTMVFERMEDIPLRDSLINKASPIIAGQTR